MLRALCIQFLGLTCVDIYFAKNIHICVSVVCMHTLWPWAWMNFVQFVVPFYFEILFGFAVFPYSSIVIMYTYSTYRMVQDVSILMEEKAQYRAKRRERESTTIYCVDDKNTAHSQYCTHILLFFSSSWKFIFHMQMFTYFSHIAHDEHYRRYTKASTS